MSAPAGKPPWLTRPGNALQLRHGAYSPRHVDPLAAELVELVLADPATEYLAAAHWRPALWAWARAEAQTQLLTEYLARAGEEFGDGVGDLASERVRSAYLLLHRAEARADRSRARLGLDPLSAARLGRDKAAASVDLARLMAELQRRELAAAAEDDGAAAVGGHGAPPALERRAADEDEHDEQDHDDYDEEDDRP